MSEARKFFIYDNDNLLYYVNAIVISRSVLIEMKREGLWVGGKKETCKYDWQRDGEQYEK